MVPELFLPAYRRPAPERNEIITDTLCFIVANERPPEMEKLISGVDIRESVAFTLLSLSLSRSLARSLSRFDPSSGESISERRRVVGLARARVGRDGYARKGTSSGN